MRHNIKSLKYIVAVAVLVLAMGFFSTAAFAAAFSDDDEINIEEFILGETFAQTGQDETETELTESEAPYYEETAENGFKLIINDEADLLTEGEQKELLDEMRAILPYGSAAFETVDHNVYTASRYAENKYSEYFGRSSGTLFLIDMDNREIYIHSNGEIYKQINTTRANEITDNIYTYATRGNYSECAKQAFIYIKNILEGGKIVTPMKYATNAAFAVGIALLINFIIIYIQRRKPKEVSYLTLAAEKNYSENANKVVQEVNANMTKQTKSRHVESSGGGIGGGGGFSGGGGGGFSGGGGGGGGHSF